MKKVYVCGAITGNKNYRDDFNTAWHKLFSRGYIPVSPITEIEIPDHMKGDNLFSVETWRYCMKKAIGLLVECDYVYICNDVSKSKGARIELMLCELLSIKRLT